MKTASKNLFSEEMLNFLTEIMNIGIGNAAGAFSQLFKCDIEVKLPEVKIIRVSETAFILGEPSSAVICSRMRMIGDASGYIFFAVPQEYKTKLLALARKAMAANKRFKKQKTAGKLDSYIVEEIGNVLAGSYLTAIHDFNKMDIFHTVPEMVIDTIQAIVDESVALLSREYKDVILIKNEFVIGKKNNIMKTFFILMPSFQAIKALVNSIKTAKAKYGYKR